MGDTFLDVRRNIRALCQETNNLCNTLAAVTTVVAELTSKGEPVPQELQDDMAWCIKQHQAKNAELRRLRHYFRYVGG